MQPKPSPLAAEVSVHFFSFEIALLHFQVYYYLSKEDEKFFISH
jgi:hypothetical protein